MQRRERRRDDDKTHQIGDWIPKTQLGKMVAEGMVSTMSAALATRLRLREPEIVDILLPEMADEVLDVNMVQRMTDSGRRVRFAITVVVGNSDGFVGVGRARGKEVGPAIRKAIDIAKLNLIELRRGCGSWECGCGKPHTLPFATEGKSGSVVVTFKPAPRGVGLAVADIPKHVLRMGGIRDAWGFSKGHSKTTVNYGLAAFEALKRSTEVRVTKEQLAKLKILTGAAEVKAIALDSATAAKILERSRRDDRIKEKVRAVERMLSRKAEAAGEEIADDADAAEPAEEEPAANGGGQK
ncbi:MAG: 30S ribosomal protein S5 [Euryarchaeota archaeon]|nr:30S ribosomal protein S5 [Euryarchaeota archaeon]